MLGHVNNVEYYRYFETGILTLLRETGLDWQSDPVIPLAAENGCAFLKPVAALSHVDIGVRIAHLGNSSVRYETAVFVPQADAPVPQDFLSMYLSIVSRASRCRCRRRFARTSKKSARR